MEPEDKGNKIIRMWVLHVIKFILRAAWLTMSVHLKRSIHSCEMTFQVESVKRMSWFRWASVYGCSAKKLYGVVKGTTNTNVDLQVKQIVWSDFLHLRGRPPVTEAQFNEFQAAFIRSPRKSTRNAARKLIISHTILCKILRKHVKFKSHGY